MIQTAYRFALATTFCFCFNLGCNKNDDNSSGGGGASDQEVMTTCKTYCDQAQVCDGDVQAGECLTKCQDRLGDCMADEQSQTLEDLESCSAMACDDFKKCTIGAGLQCVFGI